MTDASVMYYATEDGGVSTPLEAAEMVLLVRQGVVDEDTLVFCEDAMATWTELGDCEGLEQLAQVVAAAQDVADGFVKPHGAGPGLESESSATAGAVYAF